MISQILGLVIRHLPLVFQILFVTNEDSRDILLSMLVYFTHPFGHFGKRVPIRDIVGHNDAMGSLIVRRCDSLESLLSCRIPDLKLDRFAVYINGSDLEVDSDGRHEVVMEYIVLFN